MDLVEKIGVAIVIYMVVLYTAAIGGMLVMSFGCYGG